MHSKKIRVTLLDVVICVLLFALISYILYRLTIKLNYKWRWEIIPGYFFYFDDATGKWTANMLLKGLLTTIRLSVWSMIFAVLIGAFVGILRTTRGLFNRLAGWSYVELMRNIPPLVVIFIFYFFISDRLLGLLDFSGTGMGYGRWAGLLTFFFGPEEEFASFFPGVMTVGFFQGAYIAEIVRSGINSIDKGQWEASASLGLPWFNQMVDVIMPQAARRMLPAFANEFINTVKYCAICSLISIQELTFQGLQIMAATHVTIEIWLTITALYLMLCFGLSICARRLEKVFSLKE